MKVKRLYAIAILLAAAVPLGPLARTQAEPTAEVTSSASQKTLTVEDVNAKRNTVRRDLMLNSLKDMRGLAYGAIHADNSTELEKTMLQELKQLDIPLHPFSRLKTGAKPVDGLLEVKVSKVPTANYVQLNLFQWVSLLRQPKTEVRAVTYHDGMLCDDAGIDDAVAKLTDQFVIDVLKANQKTSANTSIRPVRKIR